MSDLLNWVGGPTGAAIGVATAAAAWYMMGQSKSTVIKSTEYSIPVPGITGARMSKLCQDGELVFTVHSDVQTAYDVFVRGSQVSNNGPAFGWRDDVSPYKWVTFNDVLVRASHFGSGLLHAGAEARNSTRIGIYAQNRIEYSVCELGCYSYSMVAVPLYDTLGPEALKFIINQADLNIIVVDKQVRLKNLLVNHEDTPNLKTIITIEGAEPSDLEVAKELGVNILKFTDVERNGIDKPMETKPCQPSDVALVCYTSGTTGNPKGVQLTHENYVATCSGIYTQLQPINPGPEDVYMSYLPLAHMYERVCQAAVLMMGGKIAFYRGDIKLLLDDIAAAEPTILPAVPRVLNRIHDKVMAKVNSSSISTFLFKKAMKAKMDLVKQGIVTRNTMWDTLVFGKIQKMLGGKVRYIVSGSAPLSPNVLDFIRCATGAIVTEGYGQTENTAVAAVQMADDTSAGNVGPPIPSVMIKLVDVPDMDYYQKDGKGEICLKGPIVFIGYLKQPDKTEEVLDPDGWLHTGDIGEWLPNGSLKIIDRKKNIFKLAQGEYISPEKIENVHIRHPAIAQSYVHGDSLESTLVAIIVPDPETFQSWAKNELGQDKLSISAFCQYEDVKKKLLQDIHSLGVEAGLNGLENVKDIHLHSEMFSVENGLLTPTFKARRHNLAIKFKVEISKMYTTYHSMVL